MAARTGNITTYGHCTAQCPVTQHVRSDNCSVTLCSIVSCSPCAATVAPFDMNCLLPASQPPSNKFVLSGRFEKPLSCAGT